MSGVFHAIGKAFKSVVKVLKKVAIPALIIGAIVLTGGAAIGALPAIGSILGSIGISGGLASALGGAISAAGIGGAIGGLTGGWKGMIHGGVMGALTGGVMGAAGLVGANGLLGSAAAKAAGSSATAGIGQAGASLAKVAATAGAKGLLGAAATGGAAALGAGANTAAGISSALFGTPAGATSWATAGLPAASSTGVIPAVSSAAEAVKNSVLPTLSQTPSSGGILNSLLQPSSAFGNSGLIGSLIGGIGQGMSESEALKAAAARDQDQRNFYSQNYGVAPGSNQVTGLLAQYGQSASPLDFSRQPNNLTFQSPGRFEYDPTQRKVVFVPTAGAQ